MGKRKARKPKRRRNSPPCALTVNPRGRTLSERAQDFVSRHIRHHIVDLGMEPRRAIRTAYEEAHEKGFKVPPPPNPRRRRNQEFPTIGETVLQTDYLGGSGKRRDAAFYHQFEEASRVQAIPLTGGTVELPDGSRLKVAPGSVLQQSAEGVPLWMEDDE